MDIVWLQEIHALEFKIARLQDYYCRQWYFDPDQYEGSTSHSTAAPGKRGGVAVLSNLHLELAHKVVPLFEDLWTAH